MRRADKALREGAGSLETARANLEAPCRPDFLRLLRLADKEEPIDELLRSEGERIGRDGSARSGPFAFPVDL